MSFDEIIQIIKTFLDAIASILEKLGFKLPATSKTPTNAG